MDICNSLKQDKFCTEYENLKIRQYTFLIFIFTENYTPLEQTKILYTLRISFI